MPGNRKCATVAAVLVVAVHFSSPMRASAARPPARTSAVASAFASTSEGIGLGLAFDYAAHDANALSTKVAYVYGGYFADWNFGFYPPVTHLDGYIPFDNDPYPQTIPGHSLADWQASHPDWIVYQCDGKTPAYYGSGNTSVPLDFSNPAVRAWQLQQAEPLLRQGAAGLSIDDFTFANFASRCGVYRNGRWTLLGYPGTWQDNARYAGDMLGWLQDVRSQLLQRFPTKTLTVNLAPSVSGLDNVQRVIPYIDMDFDEAGFTAYGGHRLTGSAWQQEVAALEQLNTAGKAFVVTGIVNAADDPSVSHDQINWALANYLLVKDSRSYTYIYAGNGSGFSGSPSGYGTFYDRPEYHIPIGHATSDRYQQQGVPARQYSGGLSLVNPSDTQTHVVQLDHSYTDMYGQSYTAVTLAPGTGIVLLGASPHKPLQSGGAHGPTHAASAGKQCSVRGLWKHHRAQDRQRPRGGRRHRRVLVKRRLRGCRA